jgi:hypothetical protein
LLPALLAAALPCLQVCLPCLLPLRPDHAPSHIPLPQEIDRLLSGGGALGRQQQDTWGFAAPPAYNAFAEGGGAADAGFALSSPADRESDTPTFGAPRAGSGDWSAPAAASPDASASAGADWFGGSSAGGGAEPAGGGAAKVIGTGTVLHTFVGDYNQPEELSVFEGDKVGVGWG